MDVLSDALRVIRLAGAIFFQARLSSPWSIQSLSTAELAPVLKSHPDCITFFHILVAGNCWISLNSHTSFLLEAGDAVIFPHGDPHIMASQPDAMPQKDLVPKLLHFVRSSKPVEGIPRIDFGNGDDITHFVCGYLQCEQRFSPLIGSLPKILLISEKQEAKETEYSQSNCVLQVEAKDWLNNILRQNIEEACTDLPGSTAMLGRLTELMFVEVLRRYMHQLPAESTGWLAAVRDPEIGHALTLMHAHPERSWTVAELAKSAALSRSSLAQRFTELIGESPMQYLFNWRMQLAKYFLSQPNLNIGEIADRVGYQSEAAFNRAFKRCSGQPPVSWRRNLAL